MYMIKKKFDFARFRLIILFLFPLSLSFIGCQDDPASITPNQIEEGSWVTYSPYKWSHDGNPYSSVYCKVYSDGASYDMKRDVGAFADEKFLTILNIFDFQNMKDFRYPHGYNKIDVYINMYHEEGIAAAYWGSIFITIRSHNVNLSRYAYLFKHELTHAFEFLIEGTVSLGTDVWFREGIAIYCGGGLNGITDIDDLENWIAQNANHPDQGNPIAIHAWEDFPPGANISGYYTNVFDLTMRYFLDSNGLGKSTQDVLSLFYDVRNGVPFPVAFQNRFSISLEQFEIDYYDLMRTYLSSGNDSTNDWISLNREKTSNISEMEIISEAY
jgi:hypothetical protein